MHARKRKDILPGLMLLSGILGLELRILLHRSCADQRLLLPSGHPLGLALGAITVAALGLALYASRKLKIEPQDPACFPGSRRAFIGHILAALGILLTVLTVDAQLLGSLGRIWNLLALASVPCLLLAGWSRSRGKQPHFGLHLCPTAFLVLHTIGQYQHWSSDPQLLNYIFALLGIVCMVLFAFYHCAFDAGLRWLRRLKFFGLASICLGTAALPGCRYPWLYLGIARWAALDLPEGDAR